MIPQRRLLVLALAVGLVVGASGCSSPALSEPTPPPEAGAGAPAPAPDLLGVFARTLTAGT